MFDWLPILNGLVQAGILLCALMTVFAKKVFTAVLTLGACGAFVGLEFLILQAPDVAIAEIAVGAVLGTTLFVIALRKVTKEAAK